MTAIVRLPDIHQAYYEARMILRHPMATDEEIQSALGVLINSPDWMDMELCRQVQRSPSRASGQWSTDAPQGAQCNLRYVDDMMTRAPIRPDVTDYRAEVMPWLAFMAVSIVTIGVFLAI